MHVQHHLGVSVALDAVEVDRRARFAELGDGSSRGGQIRLEIHLVGDPKELLLCIQQLEDFTKILEGSHDCFPGFVSAVSSENGSKCRARRSQQSKSAKLN